MVARGVTKYFPFSDAGDSGNSIQALFRVTEADVDKVLNDLTIPYTSLYVPSTSTSMKAT